jgi:hypothetical protein
MASSLETLQKTPGVSDAIWNFVKPNSSGGIYSEEHFLNCARLVSKLCTNALDKDGRIPYRCNYRAKSRERVQVKLIKCDEERRAEGKQPLKAEDIVPNIRDLAAIRIILYFPSERQRKLVRYGHLKLSSLVFHFARLHRTQQIISTLRDWID